VRRPDPSLKTQAGRRTSKALRSVNIVLDQGPISAPLTPPGQTPVAGTAPPFAVPDHMLIRRIGRGSYGEVWLARNVMGAWRAVKFVHRGDFDHDRPFERELTGIQRFEPISRSHPSQLNILHVGRGPDGFYYVMELADDIEVGSQKSGVRGQGSVV
jgi:serine/threonine protein kinase